MGVAAMITDDAWIGLNDISVDDTFVWQDGSSLSYTNWFGTGNPISPANTNVNCVKKQSNQNGQWNDIGCGKELNCMQHGSSRFLCYNHHHHHNHHNNYNHNH